jgi:NADH dehydrogenase
MSQICILGGGGFVGAHLCALLSAQGHRVVVPSRRRERVKDLILLPGVEVVEADIHDPAALARLFAGMDAVINLVGILHERRAGDFQRVHGELPGKVAAACAKAGAPRLLHMSALGASSDSRSRYQQSDRKSVV